MKFCFAFLSPDLDSVYDWPWIRANWMILCLQKDPNYASGLGKAARECKEKLVCLFLFRCKLKSLVRFLTATGCSDSNSCQNCFFFSICTWWSWIFSYCGMSPELSMPLSCQECNIARCSMWGHKWRRLFGNCSSCRMRLSVCLVIFSVRGHYIYDQWSSLSSALVPGTIQGDVF